MRLGSGQPWAWWLNEQALDYSTLRRPLPWVTLGELRTLSPPLRKAGVEPATPSWGSKLAWVRSAVPLPTCVLIGGLQLCLHLCREEILLSARLFRSLGRQLHCLSFPLFSSRGLSSATSLPAFYPSLGTSYSSPRRAEALLLASQS